VRSRALSTLLVLAATLVLAPAATAQWSIGVYGGSDWTLDSDVQLQAPGSNTGVELSDVPWRSEPGTSPPYYGVRATCWFSETPNWGVGLDFTHAKMFGKLDHTVQASGTIGGTPVSAPVRLDSVFQNLSFSHGHNLLTFNVYRRWFAGGVRDDSFLGRTKPYVGGGLGIAIPHVEVDLNGGGKLRTRPLTNQIALGLSVNF
jgi:lipid A oxidase